jgi:phosphopantothenoylcysteine decarboxylase/phosphopantothenate--cysteine ligase
MNYHDTLSYLMDAFGGADNLQKLLGVGPSALSNYRRREHLPLNQARKLSNIAPEFGFNLDPYTLKISVIDDDRKPEILLIITGGIAAYKALELIRRLRDFEFSVTAVMTASAQQFITPLSVSALTGNKVYSELFDLTDEQEMGHIQLARKADLVLIAPATANFIGKMAHGLADDLASTLCLVTDAPIFVAPSMNPHMWSNTATQENCAKLKSRNISFIGPDNGDTACGETGSGRFAETGFIISQIQQKLLQKHRNADIFPAKKQTKPLDGIKILITAGPTLEPIDPVRFIGNRSSGKQGYAIASACAEQGADVCLISGPVSLEAPLDVRLIKVETAQQMKQACADELDVECVICAAAVADWQVKQTANAKLKKSNNKPPELILTETPDILSWIGHHPSRPKLVIGFAAETDSLKRNADKKRARKNADWMLANSVLQSGESVFNSDLNEILFLSKTGAEYWDTDSKQAIAQKLVRRISDYFCDGHVSDIQGSNIHVSAVQKKENI